MQGKYAIRFVWLLILICSSAGGAQVPRKPHIIFILADDLGWTDLSTGATNYDNRSDFYETPNLERLAREGMAFSSVYAQPNCSPTRAALLSGQYPPRTRVYNVGHLNRGKGTLVGPQQNEDVPAGVITVAETLKAAGYITAHFGKYHVGGHEGGASTMPLSQGFDFNFGGGPAGNPGNYFARKDPDGKWRFVDNVGPELDPYARPYDAQYVARYGLPESLIGTPKHVTDALTDAVIDFLKTHLGSGKPLYLQVHHYAIHTPNQGRPDLVAKYTAKKAAQPSQRGHDNVHVAALIEGLDQSVGRIVSFLNDPNGDGDTSDSIASQTLLLFLSDNGGDGRTNNAPLRGRKGMFTEGGIRVPFIAVMPGVIPAGVKSDVMIHVIDFYPTLAEFAGAALPAPSAQPLDGVSLVPLLLGRASSLGRSAIYYHFPGYLDTRASPCSVILRELEGHRYKLFYFYEDRHTELYDLTSDIGEQTDLLSFPPAGDFKKVYRIEAQLVGELRLWLKKTGAIYPIDPETGKPVAPPEVPEHTEPPPAPPALLYEGFTFPGGALAGRGSGWGWKEGALWTGSYFKKAYEVKPGGLTFPGIRSEGCFAERKSYEGRGAAAREVDPQVLKRLTAPGAELWFSVLVRNKDTSSNFESQAFLFASQPLRDDDGSYKQLLNYNLGDTYAVGFLFDVKGLFGSSAVRACVFDGNGDGSGMPRLSSGAFRISNQAQVHLVVGRIRWAGKPGLQNEISLWVLIPGDNAAAEAPVPLGEPSCKLQFSFDPSVLRFVTFGGRRWAAFDEIRFGESAAAVGVAPGGETSFLRGDANADGVRNLADAISVLQYLFGGAGKSACLDAADANDDEKLDVADAVYLLRYLFAGGAPPPPPFSACGLDTTGMALACNSFPPCM